MVILFVVNTFTDIREWRREQESGKGASQISQEEKQVLLKSLLVVVSMAVYVILMPHIGFIITTAVFAGSAAADYAGARVPAFDFAAAYCNRDFICCV